MRRIRLVKALERMIDGLDHGDERALADDERVSVMERQLVELAAVEAASGEGNGFIHLVGQSHIDLAWLWPLKETVRKAGRTFSTVCTLMERYPEFRYSQSQPQLYAYVKRYYPELFERIKEYVREGRWELVGGMWVEPDLHEDRGEHEFTYSLYPPCRNWRDAHVVREAAALNTPLRIIAGEQGGLYPELHCWMDFHSDHVILDTIKSSEDGSGSVLRLYESSGGRSEAVLRGLSSGVRIYEASLLEEEQEELQPEQGKLRLKFKPYEIKTIKIKQDTK